MEKPASRCRAAARVKPQFSRSASPQIASIHGQASELSAGHGQPVHVTTRRTKALFESLMRQFAISGSLKLKGRIN